METEDLGSNCSEVWYETLKNNAESNSNESEPIKVDVTSSNYEDVTDETDDDVPTVFLQENFNEKLKEKLDDLVFKLIIPHLVGLYRQRYPLELQEIYDQQMLRFLQRMKNFITASKKVQYSRPSNIFYPY